MVYKVTKSKEEGLVQLKELVKSFSDTKGAYFVSSYNETQLRNDFIDPFLKSLGWDVDNEAGKTQFLRDVIQEEAINVEDEIGKKNPDYTLRVQGNRKLFVEAKKPFVDISSSSRSAFQLRRYGWNANLGISILTNFDKLIIYDCRHKPSVQDDEHVARIRLYSFTDYIEQFEQIYNTISFDAVISGKLDDTFSILARVGETFDEYFLQQIENWRVKIARAIVTKNNDLTSEDINFLVQRLLNRIVFLRICEDRTIEQYETLKGIKSYDELKTLFLRADKKYNSGLFNFIEDNLSLAIDIAADTLIEIFNELYYPLSPYDFSVVDPSILSQIYERFLGSYIALDDGKQLSIVSEPEVLASNGVVPTPKLVVEKIVKETLQPLIEGKTLQDIRSLKIADICCGSGTFLISVYDFLLRIIIEKLLEEKIEDPILIYQLADGTFALTLVAKRKILEQNIYGVDINPYAVEVSEFSLLLKLLEGEGKASVDHYINQHTNKVLPDLADNIKCGNSLVDNKFLEFIPEALEDDTLLFKIKPFEWFQEFPFLSDKKGFDAIVGNPPYVRIQNLVKFAPQEVKYYQSDLSGYTVVKKETIDKYYVFIQRAILLLNPTGYLGYIIPHKFFINKGGVALRHFITTNSYFSKIIHFGVTQVFPERSTYTAIIVLQKASKENFLFKRLKRIAPELFASTQGFVTYNQQDFSALPWIFLSRETEAVFNKLCSGRVAPLKSFADICVGLQTSADRIYIFKPVDEGEDTFSFYANDRIWEVEKDICRPCIYDLPFGVFDTVGPNAQMIFPYIVTEGKAELIDETTFANSYPLCWEYLNVHKAQLSKRSINGGSNPQWYQFGRSQSLTRFHDSSKLIWHVLSTRPTYLLDELNMQFTGGGNGPYYSLINNSEYSILYFMGILAHPIFENMVKAGASEFRGAYYSHGKQFIESIPIRMIESDEEIKLYKVVVKTVKGLIETKRSFAQQYGAKRTVLQRKFDILNNTLIDVVNKLYGITDVEFTTVLHDEMFSSELILEEE